jgi:hypothetical protein
MPPYLCQPDAFELRPGRVGGQATGSRRYNDGEKALREMDTEGHQEHGRYRVKNAGFSRSLILGEEGLPKLEIVNGFLDERPH